MRQSIEVDTSTIHARGPGWFLLSHDGVLKLKHGWSEAVKFEDLSHWAKSASAELRGLIARRAALRLMPLAWIVLNEDLSGEHFSVIDQVLECLVAAQLDPQSRATGAHVYQIFDQKLPYELTRICVGVEEALDSESSGGFQPCAGIIDTSWAVDAKYTQQKHSLARMPEPEESNAFLAVCTDIHPGGSNSESLWNHCAPTEAWLDSVAAMQNGPQTHAVETYLTRFASPVIDGLHASADVPRGRDQKQKEGYISRLLSKFSAKE